MPTVFPPSPPTTQTGVWEDGPGIFANPSNSGIPALYNGQTQVANINSTKTTPPQNFATSAADKNISKIK
jgi:hypothetical protein